MEWWVVLLIGIAIGWFPNVLASVVGNLYTDRVQSFLDARSHARNLKSLTKERERFALVCRIRAEQSFAQAYYADQTLHVLTLLFLAVLLFQAGRIGHDLPHLIGRRDQSGLHYADVVYLAGCYMGVFAMSLALFVAHRLRTTLRFVRSFDLYRQRLVAKWPDEPWSQVSPQPSEDAR